MRDTARPARAVVRRSVDPSRSSSRNSHVPVFRVFRVPAGISLSDGTPSYLLVHGVGLSHRFYAGLAGQLSSSGNVISLDLPGFGLSPTPSQNLTIGDYAEGVATALRQRASARVIVVGHSMGAQIAAELALRHPDLIAGVVLVGPVVDPARPTLLQQALALARDATREPSATLLATLFDYARCGPPWFLRASQAMTDYDLHRSVPRLIQPVLVVRGEHDPIASAPWCRQLVEMAVDGELATISGRRHHVPHSDPVSTARVIVSFASRRT